MNILILGAGGHASVLLHTLRSAGQEVVGLADLDAAPPGRSVGGVPVLREGDVVKRYPPGSILLANGLGVHDSTEPRRKLHERFKALGYSFATVVSPSAHVAPDAELAAGAQILTHAVIHPRATVGEDTVVNTAVIVEHDCVVGEHSFLGPGAILCGEAKVGPRCFICSGAVVVPQVSVGPDCLVAAGAVVTRDLPAGARVAGVPARPMAKGRRP